MHLDWGLTTELGIKAKKQAAFPLQKECQHGHATATDGEPSALPLGEGKRRCGDRKQSIGLAGILRIG